MTHTSTEEPEALQLADQIEGYANTHPMGHPACNIRAAEKLRYQHVLLIELADQLSGSKNRIADLEAQLSAIGAGGVEPLRGSRHVHECREALAACIKLLKKTPKITRDIYVGKDRQAWGVQAKAVLDAAVAALNQKDEK